jgi:hypothetical protein
VAAMKKWLPPPLYVKQQLLNSLSFRPKSDTQPSFILYNHRTIMYTYSLALVYIDVLTQLEGIVSDYLMGDSI